MLSVAGALARVLDQAAPLPCEEAPLAEAHGRVLAADLAALRTQPPADLSAMDGYAVRAADVAAATKRGRQRELMIPGVVISTRSRVRSVAVGREYSYRRDSFAAGVKI